MKVNAKKIKNYHSFFQIYLKCHVKKDARIVHFIAISLFFLFAWLAIYNSSILAFAIGTGLASGFVWLSELCIEKNKPCFSQYPIWLITSEFRLWFHVLLGAIIFENKIIN